jgi:hypothetical protein
MAVGIALGGHIGIRTLAFVVGIGPLLHIFLPPHPPTGGRVGPPTDAGTEREPVRLRRAVSPSSKRADRKRYRHPR